MVTLGSVLRSFDALRPNTYDAQTKTDWLNRLEGEVALEVLGMEEYIPLRVPEDNDRELLIPPPHEGLYGLYLGAMLDFHNREFSEYQNGMDMFNEASDAFQKWYRRGNLPVQANSIHGIR